MRGYITVMYYDEPLRDVLSDICDTESVNEAGRERDKIVISLRKVANIVETDKMFVIHV